MKASIYIPDELYQEVQEYLKIYPQKNLSGLVREALEERLKPKTSRLLELAGFVSSDKLAGRQEVEKAILDELATKVETAQALTRTENHWAVPEQSDVAALERPREMAVGRIPATK
jgi:metal-responsive CopG/Arc/MetJ family transcriptional regulator